MLYEGAVKVFEELGAVLASQGLLKPLSLKARLIPTSPT